ncbi:MAG: class I SAM-dependent methyltransferase [Candidatus Saccharibacteria bacterium]
MDIPASTSENNGIALLADQDLNVYSVGISTGGVAEMRMAQSNPQRHIIATTIDQKGVDFAAQRIAEAGLSGQIETKLEDASEPLPYGDETFDYVYARLVLHYLPKNKLIEALTELHRVLKPGGRLFVVVRSTKCPDATRPEAHFDPETCLTTCTVTDDKTSKPYTYARYFHSQESISTYVADAGFAVEYVKSYDEHLYVDFMRTKLSPETDNVIELLADK